jgi:hypothetical protein
MNLEEAKNDLLEQLLIVWAATDKDSTGRPDLEMFEHGLQVLDAEFQVKIEKPDVETIYAWTANRVFVWRENEGWKESLEL